MKVVRGGPAMAACVVLLGSGCDATTTTTPPQSPDTTAASTSNARLHATLVQYRRDEGTNIIDVQFSNPGNTEVTVRSVRIRWPGLKATQESDQGATYDPGRTIDLRTTYGTVVCTEGDRMESAHAVATLADGGTLDVAVDRHGTVLLRRLYARDCALERLHDVALIALGTTFRLVRVNGKEYLSGDLILRRPNGSGGSRDEALTVTELDGSILLSFRVNSPDRLPATLRPRQPELTIPVLIGASYRCDPHARGESKQTFLFSVFTRREGEGSQRSIVVPDASVQRKALAVIDRACG